MFYCCSVPKSRLTLWDPMDCSTQGFPILHYLPEFVQIHVHWVSDAIQPPYPLSSPSPPALNLSQHQGLYQWVGSSHGGQSIGASVSASVLPMNLSKGSYVYHWAFRHVLWKLILLSFLSLCCPLAQLSPLPTLSLTFSLRGTFLESFFFILTLVFLLNTPMYCYVRVHFIPPLVYEGMSLGREISTLGSVNLRN